MESIVCNGCSLLCDDVVAEVSGKNINSLGLCRLGQAHLETAIASKIVSNEKKLEKAASILMSAKSLLLYGWTYATNEAVNEGLDLATTLKGHFGSSAELGPLQVMSHGIHMRGLDIDLEYVRNNGEFIIYWGTNPSESLHRHPSRFAVLPRGKKIPEGIESRTIGVVDVRQTETMKMANHRLIIPIGSDAELLGTVIAELDGRSAIKSKVLGIPASELIGFVKGLQKVDCIIIFYGGGVINSGNHDANLSGITKLIAALRAAGKDAYALPMFVQSNAMGVTQLAQEHKIGADSLQKLTTGEFDTTLIVGDDVLTKLPGPAARAIAKTQIVYVGPPGGLTDKRAAVSIHTTDTIISGSGSMKRLDMNKIEFTKWKASTDDETLIAVLQRLHEIVRAKMA